MKDGIFVNKAFTEAINDYLSSKSNPDSIMYNSFLVVVIRLLTIIYDELDILNPFYLNDELFLNQNLEKYGYSFDNINSFKNELQKFYENNNSLSFINIQKYLIDMFALKNKTLNLKKEDIDSFHNLLYTPSSTNILITSYNYLMAVDVNEIENYYVKKLNENKYKKPEKVKRTLNMDAYEALKYSFEDINNMSAEELENVNKKVYNYFDINENAINKDYLLERAVYELNNPKPSFSTGNGYVDILLILSVVATLGLTIFLLTIFVF